MKKALEEMIASPFFAIFITLAAYKAGNLIRKKINLRFLPPFLIAVVLLGALLYFCGISYDEYMAGGQYISLFMGPVTIILAVPVYRHMTQLKQNLIPVLVGITVGAIVSFFTVLIPCRLLGLDRILFISMVPHSVTTPIAASLSEKIGGISSLTILSLIISGNLGAILYHPAARLFRIKSSIASGVALGTTSHIIGTAKALELGDTEGAFSGLSIGVAGIITSFLAPLLLRFF